MVRIPLMNTNHVPSAIYEKPGRGDKEVVYVTAMGLATEKFYTAIFTWAFPTQANPCRQSQVLLVPEEYQKVLPLLHFFLAGYSTKVPLQQLQTFQSLLKHLQRPADFPTKPNETPRYKPRRARYIPNDELRRAALNLIYDPPFYEESSSEEEETEETMTQFMTRHGAFQRQKSSDNDISPPTSTFIIPGYGAYQWGVHRNLPGPPSIPETELSDNSKDNTLSSHDTFLSPTTNTDTSTTSLVIATTPPIIPEWQPAIFQRTQLYCPGTGEIKVYTKDFIKALPKFMSVAKESALLVIPEGHYTSFALLYPTLQVNPDAGLTALANLDLPTLVYPLTPESYSTFPSGLSNFLSFQQLEEQLYRGDQTWHNSAYQLHGTKLHKLPFPNSVIMIKILHNLRHGIFLPILHNDPHPSSSNGLMTIALQSDNQSESNPTKPPSTPRHDPTDKSPPLTTTQKSPTTSEDDQQQIAAPPYPKNLREAISLPVSTLPDMSNEFWRWMNNDRPDPLFLYFLHHMIEKHQESVKDWDAWNGRVMCERYPQDLGINCWLPHWLPNWPTGTTPWHDMIHEEFEGTAPFFVTLEEGAWLTNNMHRFTNLWKDDTRAPFLEAPSPDSLPYQVLHIRGAKGGLEKITTAIFNSLSEIWLITQPPWTPPGHLKGWRYPLLRFHYRPNNPAFHLGGTYCSRCFLTNHYSHDCPATDSSRNPRRLKQYP